MNFLKNIFRANQIKNEVSEKGVVGTIGTEVVKNAISLKVKIIMIAVCAAFVLLFCFFACFAAAAYTDDEENNSFGLGFYNEPTQDGYGEYGNDGGYIAVGSGSAIFDDSYTKEDFIKAVNSYQPPNETFAETGKTTKWGYETFFKSNADHFFDIATSYGLDPRFIFSIGIHESYFGTSEIAIDKGNFFGWGAYDSSPYSSALTFYDMSNGIDTVSKGLANTYIAESGEHHQSIINKGYDPSTIEGIGSVYASDPQWAQGVKGHMQRIFGSMQTSGNTGSNNSNVGGGSINSATGDGYKTVYTSSSGKKYKEYKQNASYASYKNSRYGSKTIGAQGCSVTALAIVASGLGYNYTPAHWSGGIISIIGGVQSYAPRSTLTNTSSEGSYASLNVQAKHKSNIQNHLKSGNPVIIHVMSANSYTGNQHWMALLDISADGSKVYVSNPNVSGANGWADINTVLKALCCYIRVQK